MAQLKEEGSNGLKEHGGGGSHIVLDELDGVGRPFFAFAVVVNLGRRPFVALRKVIDRLIAAGFHLLADLSTKPQTSCQRRARCCEAVCGGRGSVGRGGALPGTRPLPELPA